MDRTKFDKAAFADEIFSEYVDSMIAKIDTLKKEAEEIEELDPDLASRKISRSVGMGLAVKEAFSRREALHRIMDDEVKRLREELKAV